MRKPILLLLALLLVSSPVVAGEKESQTVRDATEVVQEIMKIPEKGIPPAMLRSAHAVAIIPGMIKAGFIVGGKYGRGVLVLKKNGDWKAPVFVRMIGGSFGWQIGAQSTDVVLVFMSEKSVSDVFSGKITLGADAAVAAGPVGRRVEGATDIKLRSEIYSYSRSRGLFAGVSLEGASLDIDHAADGLFYGREGIMPQSIVKRSVTSLPVPARRLLDALRQAAAGR
ncbi:lipid-binding SYLF domain-containing protein [Geothermobacter ehrlichii]|uniref:Lipid-binding SYLF domain-containing protein n=1 Tax=Geothermobacter ehrlichii TaxID=213224 RepID=A0A5D3WL75_9BACT|nr:lipid-binding SYLF domain-containing protein [Geothermobacter ehrlichii]TYO98263.1 lipid-binding SYLF domain-containing protein [Geothermobacter ehrlichii]